MAEDGDTPAIFPEFSFAFRVWFVDTQGVEGMAAIGAAGKLDRAVVGAITRR